MNPAVKFLSLALLGGTVCFGAGASHLLAAGFTRPSAAPSPPSLSEPSAGFVTKLAPLAEVPLTPNDGAPMDEFGKAVALSGDGNTALVGAPGKSFGTGQGQGGAYIFVRNGRGWLQQAELTASDAGTNDTFGWAVALSADGNTALVGALNKSFGGQTLQGSAYIFVYSGSNWLQQAQLTAGDAAANDWFGCAVALSGDGNTALVGASLKTLGTQTAQGSAYIFVRNDSGWRQQAQLLAGDGTRLDEFGAMVALSNDGNTALVGAPNKAFGTQLGWGSTYVFGRNGNSWSQETTLTANDGGASSPVGGPLALSGDGNTALVGAFGKTVGSQGAQGSCFVFVRSSPTWSQQAELTASDGAVEDMFGVSVALSGDGNTALVANTRLSDYVFGRTGTNWSQQAALTAGKSVALSNDGNTALVGTGESNGGQGSALVLGSTHTITVSADPVKAGTVGGDGTFAAGSAQMVTAQANPGYAFTNWTENGVVVSAAPNYAFALESDRNLVAHFVSVAAPTVSPVPGTYRGLFLVGGDVAHRSSGTFTLTTTAKGTLSASFLVGGTRYATRGAFDSFGCCTQNLNSAKGSACSVHLQLDAADPDRLFGTVRASDGSWSAALEGDRAVLHRVTNVAPQAGRYTLVIPGSSAVPSLPGGDGYGTVKVDAAGKLTLAGSLADSTSISQASVLSKAGRWPLYARLHSGRGSLLGWLSFATPSTNAAPTNDVSGTLAWFKPVLPKARYYPGGFSLQTTAPGFRYLPPAKGAPLLGLSQAALVLSGGGLTQPLTNYLTLGANNRVTSTNQIRLLFSPSTGVLRGSLRTAAGGSLGTISFRGVVLQPSASAQGYFLGASGYSGEVTFGAP